VFYEKLPHMALRFGDVLHGYVLASAKLKAPFVSSITGEYAVEVRVPEFCVLLSPCCSIGKDVHLSPLVRVNPRFFSNPYFAEDLTGINRRMQPEQAFAPAVWARLTPAVRDEKLRAGFNYTLLENFIYDKHEMFPEYSVDVDGDSVTTRRYMIDFRNTCRLTCTGISAPTAFPVESKLLQLSVEARASLRDKIAYFYSRVPQEDSDQAAI
jgi:hypothetical protein